MGRKYIKKDDDGEEHIYEERNGFIEELFGDMDKGKLHENLDGSKETRNSFSEDYKVEKESEYFGLVPKGERRGSIDNRVGTFKKERFDKNDTFYPDKESSYKSSSSSEKSYSGGGGGSDRGGLIIFYLILSMVFGGVGMGIDKFNDIRERNNREFYWQEKSISYFGFDLDVNKGGSQFIFPPPRNPTKFPHDHITVDKPAILKVNYNRSLWQILTEDNPKKTVFEISDLDDFCLYDIRYNKGKLNDVDISVEGLYDNTQVYVKGYTISKVYE